MTAPTIFISYSHADEAIEAELVKQLKVLELEGQLDVWDDRAIAGGSNFNDDIAAAVERAAAAILIVSAEFLTSDYVRNKEVPRLLERRQAEGIPVIPVIARQCPWTDHDWLKVVNVRPKGATPLNALTEPQRDDALTKLAMEVRDLLTPVQQTEPAADVACPYPGLLSFDRANSRYFFGRERETGIVLERFRSGSRLQCIMGDSGCGKSSLALAGVATALESDGWRVLHVKPGRGESPFHAIAAGASAYDEIADALRTDPPIGWRRFTDDPQAGVGPDGRLLLLVDQLEEIFTRHAAHAVPFLDALAGASAAEPRLAILATIRSDFYARALDSEPFERAMQEGGHFPLSWPGRTVLADMIEKPAAAQGVKAEPALVRRLLDDATAERGALPLLGFALREMWQHGSTQDRLSLTAYDGLAKDEHTGLRGAIARLADRIEFDDTERDALPRLFRDLVDINAGDGSMGGVPTRRRAALAPLRADLAANRVIARLTRSDTRLLVTGGDPGAETVEVAHEALFGAWPPLAEWIDAEGDALFERRRLEQAALEWDTANRPDELRWRHERLAPALAAIARLGIGRDDFAEPLATFAVPEADRLVATLEDPAMGHHQREAIGLRLAAIGDPRPGLGLDAAGLPDIVWCDVPAGLVRVGDDGTFGIPYDYGDFAVQSFAMSRYPVTWRQWRAFLTVDDGYDNDRWWQEWPASREESRHELWAWDNYPAVNVTWFDATAFCLWLSARREERIRLPNEWEWQWAAMSAREKCPYPWGRGWDEGVANTVEAGIGRTSAVGLYPAGRSRHGVDDLAGLVWEWTRSGFKNPRNEAPGEDDARVLRGGSWDYDGFDARAEFRNRLDPVSRRDDIGFRVVCSPPIKSSAA